MNDLIIIDLPKKNGEVTGLWYDGYPVHKGATESSLNYATLLAHEQNIIPDQKRIHSEYELFKNTLKKAGFRIHSLPFPKELNQKNNLHHDAIFIRDAGMMIGDKWIQANFSVTDRQIEASIHAKAISQIFNKQIVKLPERAFMEFGEVYFLQTANGSYYFGGLSRSNKTGHDAVRKIINPDHYCLIESQGYHIDTVLSPVISKDNILIALLVVVSALTASSLKSLHELNIPIIPLDESDGAGRGVDLGKYATNVVPAPGLLINCSDFSTPGVEDKLRKLKIQRLNSPLTDFRFAGGSYHCLTNEIYH